VNRTGHFWFSAQQDAVIANPLRERPDPMNYALINGEVVRYTHWTDTRTHGCGFTDMQYLGEGVYHHSEPRS